MKSRPLSVPILRHLRLPGGRGAAGERAARSRWGIWIAVFVCLLVGGLFLWQGGELQALHQGAASMSGLAVFALVALLPLVGAPVSALYALAGARFGVAGGLAVAAAATAIHLLGAWWIGHSWLRPMIVFVFRRSGPRLPAIDPRDAVPVCLLVTMIPGVLYAAKNYLMVLGGVRFRPFFWTCLPAYTVHSILAILAGDFSGAMTMPKLVLLAAYAIAFMAVSRHLLLRLRERRAQAHPRTAADKSDPQ